MMTIGELIELLREKADELDQHDLSGRNAKVMIGWCDGENLTTVQSIDVQIMTHLERGNPYPFVMVRAHPHLDPDAMTMRGVAADADDHLAEWTRTNPDAD